MITIGNWVKVWLDTIEAAPLKYKLEVRGCHVDHATVCLESGFDFCTAV